MRVMLALAVALSAADAAATESVAIYWQPPGQRALDGAAHQAFAEAVQPLGARLIDATVQNVISPAPLTPALETAKDEYAHFKFSDALDHLDGVQQLADAQGGGDLDHRQLSEIFFYRGLCRLETGGDDAAWEDLVRAAQLDPTRVIDPARYPPRAVAAFKRAADEVAKQARLPLVLDVPAKAEVIVDGVVTGEAVDLTGGQHFVRVNAEGFEPWDGVVTVSAALGHFAPPLHPYTPPDADQLLALSGNTPVHEIIFGALERRASGWRFVARRITLPEGTFVNEAVALGDVPVRVAVAATMRRLLPPPAPPPRRRRWLPWTIAGGAVVLTAVAITLGVVLSTSAPSVGGSLKLP